jgi:hypothetical protein
VLEINCEAGNKVVNESYEEKNVITFGVNPEDFVLAR